VAEGYMEPRPSGMRLTLYNSLPQAATFIGVKDGQVVMATTLYPDSFLGLPMDSIYEQDLKPLRDSGRFLAEVGAFAAHPDHRDTNPTLPLHIQKALYRYATEYLAIDDMVITINPKHRLYYQYLVLCDLVGEEKLYDFVNGARAVAMHNDLRTLPDRLARMYDGRPANKDLHDFFIRRTCDSIGLPAEKKPAAVWTRELIGYFFEEKTDIFAKADKKVVRFIKTLYV